MGDVSLDLVKFKGILQKLEVDPEAIEGATEDDNLEEDLGLDSLDRIELAHFVEEELGIEPGEISDGEWKKVQTVADVIKLVNNG